MAEFQSFGAGEVPVEVDGSTELYDIEDGEKIKVEISEESELSPLSFETDENISTRVTWGGSAGFSSNVELDLPDEYKENGVVLEYDVHVQNWFSDGDNYF